MEQLSTKWTFRSKEAGKVLAVVIPFVGLLIGLTQINKRGGLEIVIWSVVSMVVWGLVLAAVLSG